VNVPKVLLHCKKAGMIELADSTRELSAVFYVTSLEERDIAIQKSTYDVLCETE
jgi:hypothetical protein